MDKRFLVAYPMFVAFWIFVGWAWFRWARSGETISPRWRAAIGIAGFLFATVSTLLSGFLFIHATITGGYSFYHPVELFCIRLGSFTALLGLVAAILGKGKLRLPNLLVSAINLLLWIGDAAAQ